MNPYKSLLPFAFATMLQAAPVSLNVDLEKAGAAVSPTLWGCFFEDINFGADGGLYAELVKNRGFEFPQTMTGWSVIQPSLAKGSVTVETSEPFTAGNPHYVRVSSKGTALFGLSNEGFRGMGVKRGDSYAFSGRLRKVEGAPKILVRLYGSDGTLLAESSLAAETSAWTKVETKLVPNDTDERARLVVLLEGAGSVDLDFLSLFPEKTWLGRPGGLRADMVQALADLRPGFFRFPGGCIVEGSELSLRYPWKKTLAPVEERPTLVSRWAYDILHRPTPDYQQSFGLGFYEYFVLCEDIGAAPLPIVNCGMACQFNSGELCSAEELPAFIQDAIDLIEFANGPVTSTWGAKRAALGHPAPFGLKYLGIGNEQWGPAYIERYEKFAAALKAAHPKIRLVSSSGAFPEDEFHRFAWEKLRALKADLIDEHVYAKPEWFFANTHRYDSYDRNGPKVVMGEFAAQSVAVLSTKNRNTLGCALAEAAFMTGLERNADVVEMAAYAPLFAHKDAWQWTPDLIWTDNLNVVRTPSYHVQQMFSTHRGDQVLRTTFENRGDEAEGKLAASATWEARSSSVFLKLVNALPEEKTFRVDLSGIEGIESAEALELTANSRQAENTFSHSEEVVPRRRVVPVKGSIVEYTAAPNSFQVLLVRARPVKSSSLSMESRSR